MKHISLIGITIITLLSVSLQAQIYIGEENENVTGASTLLSFEDDPANNTKGIILPAVTSLPLNPANGTFIFDTTDDASIIRMYENNSWVDLSEAELGSSDALITNDSDDVGEGTVIGAETSPSNGVLVLESSSKAIILPKIANPELHVKSPYPGMICYDTVSQSLAVFDGSHWYFWK